MNAGSDQIKQMDTFRQYTTYLLVSYVVYASLFFLQCTTVHMQGVIRLQRKDSMQLTSKSFTV